MPILWNSKLELIISDVDETIAELYLPASEKMLKELENLLDEGLVLFLISGQSKDNIYSRIIKFIKPELRKRIIVGHCSGAEVWGFNEYGSFLDKPYYSAYELIPLEKKTKWRKAIELLEKEFKLKQHSVRPIKEFINIIGTNPFDIMVEDRGPQITFEMVNGINLAEYKVKFIRSQIPDIEIENDFRIPIIKRAEALFKEGEIPITSRLAGEFAIDFAVEGVSKKTAVKLILDNEIILQSLALNKSISEKSDLIEIWGDKFSVKNGGTDRHISEALHKDVRSIDFRREDPSEFLEGYNIVIWNGNKTLQYGLLEYLKSR